MIHIVYHYPCIDGAFGLLSVSLVLRLIAQKLNISPYELTKLL